MSTLDKQLLDRFKDKHVLVIGDFILDRYLHGSCNRLTPEASVPVIDIQAEYTCLGGSANVVANLRQLGAQVTYITLLGQDESAKSAITLLKEKNVSSLCVHFTQDHPTLTKTRLLKDGQILYRIDVGTTTNHSGQTQDGFLTDIEKAYSKCDAVFVSDYEKGSINSAVIDLLARLRTEKPKILVIDAKNFTRYKNLTPDIIKPNYTEALHIVGEHPENNRVKQALSWSKVLWQNTQAGTILISLDQDGIVLNKRQTTSFHYTVPKIKANNTSGAGDTFLSTYLLAHLSGASDYQAATIACTAASVGIQKAITASCTLSELRYALLPKEDKVLSSIDEVKCLAETIDPQKQVIFTNGCFDIFHSGHAHYLRQARALGDLLVVGINTDESVQRLKGASRPVNMLSDRIEVLKALECVDYIIPFGNATKDSPEELIKALLPAIFVKGEDYKNTLLPEGELLSTLGIKIEFLPYIPHQSTTKIIDRVQKENTVMLKKIS